MSCSIFSFSLLPKLAACFGGEVGSIYRSFQSVFLPGVWVLNAEIVLTLAVHLQSGFQQGFHDLPAVADHSGLDALHQVARNQRFRVCLDL
jgi:hypothetical protein